LATRRPPAPTATGDGKASEADDRYIGRSSPEPILTLRLFDGSAADVREEHAAAQLVHATVRYIGHTPPGEPFV
jgi:hypothetical protein